MTIEDVPIQWLSLAILAVNSAQLAILLLNRRKPTNSKSEGAETFRGGSAALRESNNRDTEVKYASESHWGHRAQK